jgi:hypothetical protein
LNNAYQLAESFTLTGHLSPHQRNRLLQSINTSLATGKLTAEVVAEFSRLDVSQPQMSMASGMTPLPGAADVPMTQAGVGFAGAGGLGIIGIGGSCLGRGSSA